MQVRARFVTAGVGAWIVVLSHPVTVKGQCENAAQSARAPSWRPASDSAVMHASQILRGWAGDILWLPSQVAQRDSIILAFRGQLERDLGAELGPTLLALMTRPYEPPLRITSLQEAAAFFYVCAGLPDEPLEAIGQSDRFGRMNKLNIFRSLALRDLGGLRVSRARAVIARALAQDALAPARSGSDSVETYHVFADVVAVLETEAAIGSESARRLLSDSAIAMAARRVRGDTGRAPPR